MKWPCPRDSAPVRARANATGAGKRVQVPSWPRPGRTAARQARTRRRDEEKGQARERRGHRAGRRDKVDLAPGADVGTVVLEFAQRPEREHDRAADDLRPQVKAVQVPAGYADQRSGRDRPHLHPGHRRGRPRVLARGDAHQHVPAAGHRAAARQEHGGELAAPPGPGGGDPQPGASGRRLPPGQGQHVHVLIRHVTVRDRPPLGIAGIARCCHQDCFPPVELAVWLAPPGWPPDRPHGLTRTIRRPGAEPPATISALLPAARQARTSLLAAAPGRT